MSKEQLTAKRTEEVMGGESNHGTHKEFSYEVYL